MIISLHQFSIDFFDISVLLLIFSVRLAGFPPVVCLSGKNWSKFGQNLKFRELFLDPCHFIPSFYVLFLFKNKQVVYSSLKTLNHGELRLNFRDFLLSCDTILQAM